MPIMLSKCIMQTYSSDTT